MSIKRDFINIAMGKSRYSLYFLFALMFVAPIAFFTEWGWLDIIAWLMLITLGVFIFITGILMHTLAKDSVNWPKTPAKLTSSTLHYITSNSGTKRYRPVATYSFTHAGNEFQGSTVNFDASYTSKQTAEQLLEQIRNCQPFYVHYQVQDPNHNVIYPGNHAVQWIRIVLGYYS